jgi:hypothetical protein
MSTVASRTRAKRYAYPEVAPPIDTGPRDFAILDFTVQHRVVSVQHIAGVFAYLDECMICRGSGASVDGAKCPGCACRLCHGNLRHTPGSRLACPGGLGTGRVPSPAKIVERVGQLWANRLLHRFRPDNRVSRSGGVPHCYAITNSGARALLQELARRQDGGDAPVVTRTDAQLGQWAAANHRFDIVSASGRLDWLGKNASLTPAHIAHTLRTTDLAVLLTRAVRAHADNGQPIELIERNGLYARIPDRLRDPQASPCDMVAKPASRKFEMSARIPRRNTDGLFHNTVRPDAAFGMVFADHVPRHYLIEIDMGSETLDPTKPSVGSAPYILEKYLTYHGAYRAGLHEQLYNWPGFAVCFVTTTPKRAQNLVDLLRRHPDLKTSKLFMITDWISLSAASDPLVHVWLTRTGQPATLMPKSLITAPPAQAVLDLAPASA